MLRIFGSSDDLIEVRGSIEEEFNLLTLTNDDSAYLILDDGTVVRIHYGSDACWYVGVRRFGFDLTPEDITQKYIGESEENNYTEEIVIGDDEENNTTYEAEFVALANEINFNQS